MYSFSVLKIFCAGEDGHLKLRLNNKTANISGRTGQYTTKCKGDKVIVLNQKISFFRDFT